LIDSIQNHKEINIRQATSAFSKPVIGLSRRVDAWKYWTHTDRVRCKWWFVLYRDVLHSVRTYCQPSVLSLKKCSHSSMTMHRASDTEKVFFVSTCACRHPTLVIAIRNSPELNGSTDWACCRD